MKIKKYYFLLLYILYLVSCDESAQQPLPQESSATITITSPEYKYYTINPALTYSTTNASSVDIKLNSNPITINNGEQITDLITGFNDIEITVTDNNGISKTESIVFFINKLILNESDNFNRADNTEIGWTTEYGTSFYPIVSDDYLQIKNNNLVLYGSNQISSEGAGGGIIKPYDPITDFEIIQKIKVNYISQFNWATATLKISNDQFFIVSELMLYKDGGQFRTALKMYERYSNVDYPIAFSNNPDFDFNNGIQLLFYRKHNSCYCILIDSTDDILNVISTKDYAIHENIATYNSREINMWYSIDGVDNSSEIIVNIDDYEFYR